VASVMVARMVAWFWSARMLDGESVAARQDFGWIGGQQLNGYLSSEGPRLAH
jgi:hypothetical protein